MSDELEATRDRAILRQFARDRGGLDPGREVDRLKARSADGVSAALLDLYEAGGIPNGSTVSLTAPSGAAGVTVYFMYDVSGYGGDGYGA